MSAETTPPPEFYRLCTELVGMRYRCRVVRTTRDEVFLYPSDDVGRERCAKVTGERGKLGGLDDLARLAGQAAQDLGFRLEVAP